MEERLGIAFYCAERAGDGWDPAVPESIFERLATELEVDGSGTVLSYSGPPDHPGVASARVALEDLGFKIIPRGGKGDPKKCVVFSKKLVFDESDLDEASLLEVKPMRNRFDRREQEWLASRSILGNARSVRTSVHLGADDIDTRRLYCSSQCKDLIENSGLGGFEFEEVELKGRRVTKSQQTWHLAGAHAMPRILDDYRTDSGVEERCPAEGTCWPDVPWKTPVYRYSREALDSVTGDLCSSMETFGFGILRSQITFCSQAFRALCLRHKWKVEFQPVLFVGS